jgi:O-antigen ligase
MLYPVRDVFRCTMKGVAYAAAASTFLAIALTDYVSGRLGDTSAFNMFAVIANNACYGILAVVYLRRSREITRSIAMILASSMFFALYLAFAKTEIIALVVAGVVYVLLAPGSLRQRLTRIVWMVLALALALASLSSKINGYTNVRGGATASTLTGRTILWAETYQQITSGPFVHGYGLLSFPEVGPKPWGRDPIPHAHDEFLMLWFQYGLVGVALVFGSYFSLGHTALKSLKRGGGGAATLVLCAIVWCLVKGITEADPVFCLFPIPWLILFDCVISTHIAEAIKDSRRLRSYEGM